MMNRQMIIKEGKTFLEAIKEFNGQSENLEPLYWLENYGEKAKLKTPVRDFRDLFAKESIEFLWPSSEAQKEMDLTLYEETHSHIMDRIQKGQVYRINTAHKNFQEWLSNSGNTNNLENSPKKKVNILGLGDVGSTMALALCLYGKGSISEIGLYDLDPHRVKRWELELNQIAEPLQDELPKVHPIALEELFDCDLFAFTASVGVPPVTVTEGDVRLVQFAGNSKLVEQYAQMAIEANYKGIFAIVSDPVDQLCRHAYESSNTSKDGVWHGRGLIPEQIRGYGLGVMNGRAAYYAKGDGFEFNPEGRVYGPHGKGLVVANDWREGFFNPVYSEKWTEETMTANLKMREIGYKPYIAPAVASGAISIVKTLTGEKHYSCISFDGFYYGCLNQYLNGMDLPERLDSAPELVAKIKASAEEMETQWQKLR